MRTVNFRDGVLYPVAHLLGIDPTLDLNNDHARAWVSFINSRLRYGWEFWDWPEFAVTEERAFRTIWNATRVVAAGDEVFYIPTLSYYKAILTPPVGTLPTNATYYAPTNLDDFYVAYDQIGRRPIGQVLGVYSGDPRINGATVYGLRHRPTMRGIDISPYYSGGPTVFVKYRLEPSEFTVERYDPAKQYRRSNLIYFSDGECYQAVNDVLGTAPGTPIYWRKVPMPFVLSEYVKYAAAADAADDLQAAAAWKAEAEDALECQVDKLAEQGEVIWYKRGRCRGAYLSFAPLGAPLSGVGSGGATTTLTDVDDFAGGPLDTIVQVKEAVYLPNVDALRGTANSLDQVNFALFATGSLVKIKITVGGVLSTQEFSIETGPADVTDPTGSVAILNDSARHLQKVGGY